MSLALTNVDVTYGGVIQVLRSVNLEVPDGQVVVLLGSNGAGKTTTLRAISGLLHADLGLVTAGKISVDGHDITRADPVDIFDRGGVLFELASSYSVQKARPLYGSGPGSPQGIIDQLT